MKKIYLLTLVLFFTIAAISQPPTTNLKVWYDADVNVTVNGSNEVTGWLDMSGNANDATAVLTGATLELISGNNGTDYPFVHFTDNSFLSSAYTGSATGNLTIFLVLNNAQNASHAVSFRNSTDSVIYPSANFRDKYGVEISTDPHPFEKSMGSGVIGRNFEVVAFRYQQNRATAGVSTWRNGYALSGRTAPDLPIPALPLYIGGYADGSQSTLATADIAQVLVYDAALDDLDMNAAFTYLMNRYSVGVNQYRFSNIMSGEWSDPSIWAGGQVPGASDDVFVVPTGAFAWVEVLIGNPTCKSVSVLENSGLRLSYFIGDRPELNVGVGNGYNNEVTVKGSLVNDSGILNIHGNLYVSSNKADTLAEGIEFSRGAILNIDGNNGNPLQSVSADKALLDIRRFNDGFGNSSRVASNLFGKCFTTIVDPHLDVNGITINNLSGSYFITPPNGAFQGLLQFGDGISTESSNNPKGFLVSGDIFFPMGVIITSNAANNRRVTNEGNVTYNAGLKINAGALLESTGGVTITGDLENNGTLNQRNSIGFSQTAFHTDSVSIKGTGIFNMTDNVSPLYVTFTGIINETSIRKVGIYVPLTIDRGEFSGPNIRAYLHQSLTIRYDWQRSAMEDFIGYSTDPSYFICVGPSKLINNLPLLPVDTLRFYLGLENVFAPVKLAMHGGMDSYFASVNRPVTNGTNKPDLLDFEWNIDKVSPGGNTDIVFQWSKSAELFTPDSTTIVAKRFSAGAWQNRTTLTDQNSPYPNTRQCTATGITAFSPFGIGAAPLNTLPVELLTFDAEKKEETTFLTWKTAQEDNSHSFEVERATENTRFSRIGTIAAAGNSNAILNYSFTDTRPSDGVNYYRLKQVDIDGKFDYSNIIAVNFGKPDKLLLSPNPATTLLNIKLPKNKRYTSLSIMDATGKVVLQRNLAGSQLNIPLDIHLLPKGWYVLSVTGDDAQQQTFLKQ